MISNKLRNIMLTNRILSLKYRYINTNNYKKKYDIIIAGGGLVGCTLACKLAKNSIFSHLKILLLEGSPRQKFELKPDFSNRVVALNQNTKSLMNSIQVWGHVESMRVQPVRSMQVWDACSDASISFNSSDILDDDIAYIVENNVLLHAINVELEKLKNVDIVYNAKISAYELPSYSESGAHCVVKMESGDAYCCNLLLGADGVSSAVRRAMGVQYLAWSYNQKGVVATLELAESCENASAWQRFLPSGPVALLPLGPRHSSLVWSTDEGHADRLLKLTEEQFVDELNDALWKQYPRSGSVDACMRWAGGWLKACGVGSGRAGVAGSGALPPSARTAIARAAFPLGFGHATRYVGHHVALVGDAAHRVHPLAGQGVNLGFGDVKELSELLAEAIYSGLNISHHSWLEKYETNRQRHNVPTQLAIEALHRLYTLDLPPVVLIRSLGLQITNALHPLKKIIMTHATN